MGLSYLGFGESNMLFGFGGIVDVLWIDDFFVFYWMFGFVILGRLQLNLLFLLVKCIDG